MSLTRSEIAQVVNFRGKLTPFQGLGIRSGGARAILDVRVYKGVTDRRVNDLISIPDFSQDAISSFPYSTQLMTLSTRLNPALHSVSTLSLPWHPKYVLAADHQVRHFTDVSKRRRVLPGAPSLALLSEKKLFKVSLLNFRSSIMGYYSAHADIDDTNLLIYHAYKFEAMLLLSAWSTNGWLPSGHAMRMALDLGLHRALEKLAETTSGSPSTGHGPTTPESGSGSGRRRSDDEERDLGKLPSAECCIVPVWILREA